MGSLWSNQDRWSKLDEEESLDYPSKLGLAKSTETLTPSQGGDCIRER